MSVPLTDVIVLIGSFVSFTPSVDVTMKMFSACLVVSYPLPCLLGVLSASLLCYILSLCLRLPLY